MLLVVGPFPADYYVLNEMRVPHSAGIFEAAPNHGDVGKPFEVVGTSSHVAFDESQLLVRSRLEFAYVGPPRQVV